MILLALLLCVSAAFANVLRVPADYNTIQGALDAAGGQPLLKKLVLLN